MSAYPVAIITGAGSGIGRATAVAMAEAGYHTFLVGRTREKLDHTLDQIHAQGGNPEKHERFAIDLCHADASQEIIKTSLTRLGRIDAIANVAGLAPLLCIERISPQIWRQCVDTNLSSIIHLTAAVWPEFKRQKSGVIVNMSSMASIDPFPGFSIYAATKVGVNMFTRCTAAEGADVGIKAVCIAPGAVETPMLRSSFDEKTIPSECTLAADEIATVVRDCITGAKNFAPGETIQVPSPAISI